jgi:hypothetical protein
MQHAYPERPGQTSLGISFQDSDEGAADDRRQPGEDREQNRRPCADHRRVEEADHSATLPARPGSRACHSDQATGSARSSARNTDSDTYSGERETLTAVEHGGRGSNEALRP